MSFLSLFPPLVLGLAMGWLIHVRQFCLVRAISDVMRMQDSRRLRSWFLAFALSILGLEAARLSGYAQPAASIYVFHPFGIAGAALGGLLIGIGMVLAGGGVVRLLVQSGTGSSRAMIVLVTIALAAGSISYGLGWVGMHWLQDASPVLGAGFGGFRISPLPELLASLAGWSDPWQVRAVLGIGLALVIGLWALEDMWFRRSAQDWLCSAGIAGVVTAGWVLTSQQASPGGGVNLLPDLGAMFSFAVSGVGSFLPFPLLFAMGLVLGGALASTLRGEFHAENFDSQAGLFRELAGAVLIGVGGVWIGACDTGLGLSAAGVLSPLLFAGFLAMLAGIFVTLQWFFPQSLFQRPGAGVS